VIDLRWITTRRVDAVLVVLALLLSGVVVWDRGRVTTVEAESRKRQLFDAWRADEIARIDITTPERHVVLAALEDPDGERSWSLSEDGLEVEADEQAVGQFLVSLEFASWERRLEAPDAAELGLTQPAAVITLDMGKLHYVLRLGGEAPSPAGARYVEVEGGARGRQAYVITKELAGELLPAPGELRSRSLVPYLSVEVRAFVVGDVRIERGGWGGRTAGQFALTAPASALPAGRAKVRVDRRALDGWIGVLSRVKADRFIAAPEADPPGALTVELVPLEAGKATGRLVLGGPGAPCGDGEALVVRRAPDPTAGCVAADAVEKLRVDAEALVDRHVLGTAEGDVIELRLEGGGKKVELARKEAGWHMRSPVDGPTDAESANSLLEQMGRARGEIVGADDLAALGLDPPAAEVRITGLPERVAAGATDRVETVQIGAAAGGFVHVRRADDGVVLRLGADVGQTFLPRPGALRSTLVHEVALEAVRELATDCRGRKQRLERVKPGTWVLRAPEGTGLDADQSAPSELTEKLRELRALRWAADAADPSHRLEEPWCTLSLGVGEGDGARTLVVRLGAETTGGYYATADDDPAVFVAPRALGTAGSEWLLDRMALLVDADHLEAVKIVRGEARLELARQGDRLLAVNDPSDPRGDLVESVLSALVAEAVVGLGAPRPEAGFDEPLLRIEVRRTAGERPLLLLVGKGDVFRDTSVFFVRRADVDATFVVAQQRLRPLLEAL
jgi:hypothetical protein